MEIAGLRVSLLQLRNAGAVVYSLAVVATIIPVLGRLSNLIVIPYYVLVPGYFVTLLLRETDTVVERLFYSVAWSLALLASVYSVKTLTPAYQYLPINVVIPSVTIVLLAFDYFHRR